MTKPTEKDREVEKQAIEAAIEAAKANKWVMLVGGNFKQRESLFETIGFKYRSFSVNLGRIRVRMAIDGFTGESIYNAIMGVNAQENYSELGWRDIARYCVFYNRGDITRDYYESMKRKFIIHKPIMNKMKFIKESPILAIFSPDHILFINSLVCKTDEDFNAISKVFGFMRQNTYMSPSIDRGLFNEILGSLVIGIESRSDYDRIPCGFKELFTPIFLDEIEIIKLAADKHLHSWEDLSLQITGEEVVIKIGDNTSRTNFAGMEFIDKRTGKPDKLWAVLKSFGYGGNILSTLKVKYFTRQQISEINNRLKKYFGMGENPIKRLKKCYRCLFSIIVKDYANEQRKADGNSLLDDSDYKSKSVVSTDEIEQRGDDPDSLLGDLDYQSRSFGTRDEIG